MRSGDVQLRIWKKVFRVRYRERFGTTLAAEYLAEKDGIVMDHETLRQWVLEERTVGPAAGAAKPTSTCCSNWKELFMIGSRGGKNRGLMNIMDDATGSYPGSAARLGTDETI